MLSFLLILLCHLLLLNTPTAEWVDKKAYLVHMNQDMKPSIYSTHHEWYTASLRYLSNTTTTTSDADEEDPTLLYTYTTIYHGFAAAITAYQAESLRQSDAVLGVYEDIVYDLQTTRTPKFLGLESSEGLWAAGLSTMDDLNATFGDVIVGVFDTGIWPESKSFDDSGMPPVPTRWKGVCESAADFKKSACNKKLIGARRFSSGYRIASGMNGMGETNSPRDYDGHGTHTASTIAGSPVKNVSLLGYAAGTARGMASKARVAAYKVCWKRGCLGTDILAGMEAAVHDGVDVMSLSLGGQSVPYHQDPIAIGAFVAMERGILVSCAAGNSGPSQASLSNTAPWVITVGASTLDRNFPAYVVLDGKTRFTGVSLYSGQGMGDKLVPLVNGRKTNGTANLCLPGSLDPDWVRGKVVVCNRGVNGRVEKGEVVRKAGGVGMILANTQGNGEELVADNYLLPAVAVGAKVGNEIREHMKKEPNPTAALSFGGTVLDVRPSPIVAAFSSRGPNTVVEQILKPDVIGPGVNILAAWSEAVGPTGLPTDTRKTPFNIVSGTSMSCPHISGLAALLKAAHPEWSPSAIKSALMTTAYTLDNTKAPIRDAEDNTPSTPWAHGAGHVDLQKAMSPGLVYDIKANDYVAFLCSMGYGLRNIRMMTRRSKVSCWRKFSDPGELNYPSFSILFGKSRSRIVKYQRELTNVGQVRLMYRVMVDAPSMVGVRVSPAKLVFGKVGEKKKYTVTFQWKKGAAPPKEGVAFGSVMWSNRQHQVRSPVSFTWKL
ncbi:hypothetical protein Dimus_025863 [Dionaea muscipula]